jgi:hypothetical protein
MCGFDTDVYISGVQIRETYNAGAILKPTCLAAYISLEYSLEAVANDVHCSRYVRVGSP